MYDTTAFNFTMMYGLPAITVPVNISSNLKPWTPSSITYDVTEDAVMWAVDGDDDRSVAFAARLMSRMCKLELLINNQFFLITIYQEEVLLLLKWITRNMLIYPK